MIKWSFNLPESKRITQRSSPPKCGQNVTFWKPLSYLKQEVLPNNKYFVSTWCEHPCIITHGSFLHLTHPYSLCLHHSTSAQQYSCRLCSGILYLNIYACLTWEKKDRIWIKGFNHHAFACWVQLRVHTALFVAVVPAVVVPIAVPQAANAVTILALELVLLTLPGSCRVGRTVSKVK